MTAWFALDPVTKRHTTQRPVDCEQFPQQLRTISAQRQPITKSDNPPGNARDVARKLTLSLALELILSGFDMNSC